MKHRSRPSNAWPGRRPRRRRRLVAAWLSAAALMLAPVAVVVPQAAAQTAVPRPDRGPDPAHPASAPSETAPGTVSHPVPPPEAALDSQAAVAPLPPPRPPVPSVAPPAQGTSAGVAQGLGADEACLEQLDRLGVAFTSLPAIEDGACGAPRPLLVTMLSDGLVVTPPARMTCPVADALARWTRDVVAVEAQRHLKLQPVGILIGTSYECRNRNHQASGTLSEHAFANAVDISGFTFESRKSFTVGEHGVDTPDGQFQTAVRSAACAYFTTVLGPGSDPSHATHFHLDQRGRKGGFRICQ